MPGFVYVKEEDDATFCMYFSRGTGLKYLIHINMAYTLAFFLSRTLKVRFYKLLTPHHIVSDLGCHIALQFYIKQTQHY